MHTINGTGSTELAHSEKTYVFTFNGKLHYPLLTDGNLNGDESRMFENVFPPSYLRTAKRRHIFKGYEKKE